MEEILYSDELVDLAGDLEIGLISLDKDKRVVNYNEYAKPYLEKVVEQIREYCPISKGDCKNCKLGDSFFCRMSRDGNYRNIFFKIHYMENYNDSLLKESERFKRVLLDNLNSSFLIVDREGNVERSHFVGDLSILLGQRSASSSLERIFSKEINDRVLGKIAHMEPGRNREMSHFRFDLNSQYLWLDFYMVGLGDNKFFLNIDDKTGEHYLMERLDRLSEVEISCMKVDELGDKVGNLVSGILGYAEIAMNKSDNPVVREMLDSIRKISSDGINLLKLMKGYTSHSPASEALIEKQGGGLTGERRIGSSFYVDVEKAIGNLENNRDLYFTVTSDFITDYGPVPDKLPALYGENPKEAQILIHSIKGVAGILGAFSLQNEANILEGYLRKDERGEAEEMMPRFIETLRLVVEELRSLNPASEEKGDSGQDEITGFTIDSHQKELLKENIPLAEAGDYNGLLTNFSQYESFDWGKDWNRAIHLLIDYVEDIDFDGVRNTIDTLLR